MGLVVVGEDSPPVHAETVGTDQGADSRKNGEASGQQDFSPDGGNPPPLKSGDGLSRHLNGLHIDVDANAANPQIGQPPLSMGYHPPPGAQFPNGGVQFANGGAHYANGAGRHFQGGLHQRNTSPQGYPGPIHMIPMPLVIPPSPAETLHLPMTLSSPLNLDPNAREFTPSPSPSLSPSGVIGLPMPPPFSMGPAYDPSLMYGPISDVGHPIYPQNGEFGGQFYNGYSPNSGNPSPHGWEHRAIHEVDPNNRGVHSLQNSPPGREHVSRALLISGVDPSIDEARLREELSQWGPVRSLDLARKPEGLILANWFDLRHAKEALHEIQQQHLKHQREMQEMLQQGPAAEKARIAGSKKGRAPVNGEEMAIRTGVRGLVSGRAVWAQYTVPTGEGPGPDAHNHGTLVVFNLPLEMPVEELRKAFEKYGDVKELRETPSKRQHKFVEFYDVRAAAHALQSLDGMELGGKHIKIEFSRPGGQARRPQGSQSPPQMMNPPHPPSPGSSQAGGPMYGVVGWEGGGPNPPGGFPPGGNMPAPPMFMFMPAFPAGGMEQGGPMVPGIHLPGGPLPMPPLPHMFPPFGFPDHMGRFPGFPRGPPYPGASDLRGRIADPRKKGKEFLDGRGEEYAQGGPLRRPKEPPRDGVRTQYTFSEFEAELARENPRTTLMIKNIPNKYSQAMLLALLDAHCVRCNSKIPPGSNEPLSAYDFVYLPIDFKNRCNLGYAFVNFTSAQATLNLYKEFHAQQWEAFNSRKVCQVTYARVQGRKALEDHFRNSRFACDTDEYLPLVFNPPRDGTTCSPPIVAAGHLAGKIASCANAVGAVAQAHGISSVEGGGLKGPRIGVVQH